MNCNIATAYLELLANAFGLGTVIMSYPAADFMPNTKLGCHRKPLEETCFYNSVPQK